LRSGEKTIGPFVLGGKGVRLSKWGQRAGVKLGGRGHEVGRAVKKKEIKVLLQREENRGGGREEKVGLVMRGRVTVGSSQIKKKKKKMREEEKKEKKERTRARNRIRTRTGGRKTLAGINIKIGKRKKIPWPRRKKIRMPSRLKPGSRGGTEKKD